MDEQLGPAVRVAPETSATAAADAPGAGSAAESLADSEPASASYTCGLTARYILVEDIDYLTRTGKSRQVLALRWIC